MVEIERIETMTMDEFLALPETNRITELIKGEYVVTPPPLDEHQNVVVSLLVYLKKIQPKGIWRVAPTGVYVTSESFVEPDIFWVREDSDDCVLRPDGRYWEGAPDLVIEVLSPSTSLRDKRDKFSLYEERGVREYWVVEPIAKYIEVFQLVEDELDFKGVYGIGQTFTSVTLKQEINVEAAFNS